MVAVGKARLDFNYSKATLIKDRGFSYLCLTHKKILQIISLKPIEFKDEITGLRFYRRANNLKMAGKDPQIITRHRSDLLIGGFID